MWPIFYTPKVKAQEKTMPESFIVYLWAIWNRLTMKPTSTLTFCLGLWQELLLYRVLETVWPILMTLVPHITIPRTENV